MIAPITDIIIPIHCVKEVASWLMIPLGMATKIGEKFNKRVTVAAGRNASPIN